MGAPAILPLVARVEPIPGESLMSLVARSAQANVFPRLADLLAHAGVAGQPAYTPFTAGSQVESLAQLLSVETEEVRARMHLPTEGRSGRVDWAGMAMERRWIEARRRRVAPASLELSPHHPMVWSHRALGFCPQSLQQLISRCEACGGALGWSHSLGPERCEHCRARLVEMDADEIPQRLEPRLKAAAALVSTDPQVRRAAQIELPDVFWGWEPTELFTLIVELGVAWSRPQAGRGTDALRALACGTLEVTPQEIARGHELVQGWPQSLGELIGSIWRRLEDGQGVSTSLTDLGPLGRWFERGRAESAIRSLLLAHVAEAVTAAKVPLKLGRQDLVRRGASTSTLTMAQARERFGLSNRVLRRLVPDGACLISGRLGRGGALRFDQDLLAASVAWKARVLGGEAVSVAMGVPAYCLPAFVKARLLRRIEDPDALRMAQVELAYDRDSLERLVRRLGRVACELHDSDLSLAGVAAGLFAPAHWVALFKACLNGEVALEGLAQGREGVSLRLRVVRDSAQAFRERLADAPWPAGDQALSPREAALLLGVSDVAVGELIHAKLLAARREGVRWRIQLSEVMAFHDSYALGGEILGYPAKGGVRRLQFSGYEGALLSTRHLRIWAR